MTEIVHRDTAELEVAAERRLGFLPNADETERIWKLATAIQQTDFVPKSLRGNAPAIMAAMLTGRELGILPMRALRQVNVIDGRPTPSPELMLALALKAGHDVDVVETSRQRCVIEVRRSDWPEDRVRSLTWELEDAVDAGLCSIDPETGKAVARSRQGNPLPWQAYTRAMLRSRAISEACRTWLPDVVEGASYAPEELGAPVDHRGHAAELVEAARARGEDYDPLEGESDEVRAAVADALGEEPQVGPDGQEIVDAEEVDPDDPDDGTPAEPDPAPDTDDGDAGVEAPAAEEAPAADPKAAELAEELNRDGRADATPDDPFEGLSSTEAAKAAEEAVTDARTGGTSPEPEPDPLVERYGDLNVTQVATLVRTGDVELDDGTVLELPVPPLDGIALLAELERRTGQTFRKTVRATLEGALEKLNVRPADWPTIIDGPPTTDEDSPGSPDTPAEGEDTGPAYNAPREAPAGAPEPPPLPEGDGIEARQELLRRWKAAHRELAAVDEAKARMSLSARLNTGLGPDEVWATAAIRDLRQAVIEVERARASVLPF